MSVERVLSKSQARVVISMVRERERIMHEANEQIGEINAALDEQAEMMRAHFGLPEGQYIFEGNPNGVTLKMKPSGDAQKAPVEDQESTPVDSSPEEDLEQEGSPMDNEPMTVDPVAEDEESVCEEIDG